VTNTDFVWDVAGGRSGGAIDRWNGRPFASASSSDRLLFASITIRQNLWALPVAIEEGRALGPIEQLTNGAHQEINPGVSLDGTTLAFSAANGRMVSIRVMDLRTRESKVLVPPGPTDWMTLSPDGSRIAYRRLEDPSAGINVVTTRGGEPERVCADCGWSIPQGWAHDNRNLFYQSGETGSCGSSSWISHPGHTGSLPSIRRTLSSRPGSPLTIAG